MDMLLFSSVLLALGAFAKANDDRDSYSHYIPNSTVSSDLSKDDFPHVTVSLGSIALFICVGILIYFLCCRNKRPDEGFRQFTNHNEGDQPRRNSRWRNRRFFRGNRRQNYMNNGQEARHSTHVVIQPVVNLGLPSQDQNRLATRLDDFPPAGENLATAPPTYDDTMNNVMQDNLNKPPKNPNTFSYFNRY